MLELNVSGEWIGDTSQAVEQYVWPALLGAGILLCLISFLILTCALHSSTESFLIGLSLSSMLCLVCEGAKRIETYIGYSAAYQYAHGYMVAAHDWFWFTSIWIILVMSLERVSGQCNRRPNALGLCRPLQAGIATVVLYCLCFVSALPQFWEWEVKQTLNDRNETVLKSERSGLADNYYYRTIYFWYKETLTTFAPIPLCLLFVVLLCCSPDPDDDKPEHIQQHDLILDQRTGTMIPRPRPRMTGPGLFISQILCYLFLTGPWTLFTLAPHLKSHLYPDPSEFVDLLRELLSLWFHTFFLLQFFILLVHCPPFRRACCCRGTGCCSCSEEPTEDV